MYKNFLLSNQFIYFTIMKYIFITTLCCFVIIWIIFLRNRASSSLGNEDIWNSWDFSNVVNYIESHWIVSGSGVKLIQFNSWEISYIKNDKQNRLVFSKDSWKLWFVINEKEVVEIISIVKDSWNNKRIKKEITKAYMELTKVTNN